MTVPLRWVLDTNICIKQFIVDPLTPKVNQLFDIIRMSFSERSLSVQLSHCLVLTAKCDRAIAYTNPGVRNRVSEQNLGGDTLVI